MNRRRAVRVAGKLAELPLYQFDHVRIEFDRIDPVRAVIDRLQHVLACAGAEHQDTGF